MCIRDRLKDSFREPIFLYVGSQALTDTEIIYHQSKGLLVIEWNKLIASTDVYLDRYTAIFAALKNQSELSLDGKSAVSYTHLDVYKRQQL